MNCEYIENNLDDICQPQSVEAANAKEHLAHCPSCQAKVAEHQEYLKVMSGFQAPELEVGKAAKLLAQAKNQSKNHNQGSANNAEFGFFKGFAAASILFVALFSSWQAFQGATPQPMQVVSAEGFSTDVTIVIYVPEDMPNADLQITLPDNVQLAGLGDLSTLSWPVDLKEGANTLSLPIDVAAGVDLSESLRFVANIYYGDKDKEFEVNVNLTAPQNQAQQRVITPSLPKSIYKTA